MAYLGGNGQFGAQFNPGGQTFLAGRNPNTGNPNAWLDEMNRLFKNYGLDPSTFANGTNWNVNPNLGVATDWLTKGYNAIPNWQNVSADQVNAGNMVNPEAAIRATIPGLERQSALDKAKSAAKLGAGGTLMSGAYVNKLGQADQAKAEQLAQITEGMTYDASKYNADNQMKAALANQSSNLQAALENARGLLNTGTSRAGVAEGIGGNLADWGFQSTTQNNDLMKSIMSMYSGMREGDYNRELSTYQTELPYLKEQAINPWEKQAANSAFMTDINQKLAALGLKSGTEQFDLQSYMDQLAKKAAGERGTLNTQLSGQMGDLLGQRQGWYDPAALRSMMWGG